MHRGGRSSGVVLRPGASDIFQELCDVYDTDGEIELIAFTNRLRHKNVLDAIGGPFAVTDIHGFLDKIHNYAPTILFLESRIELVRNAYIRRQMLAGAALDAQRALDPDPDADIDAALDEISSRIVSLAAWTQRHANLISLAVRDSRDAAQSARELSR